MKKKNIISRAAWRLYCEVCGRVSPKRLASVLYRRKFGRPIDWENPRDINEKINWLKFNSDTSRWSELADKYRVREYAEQCGYADLLVPLYGKWDKAGDVDWDVLPNQFVMKVNNGCGDVLICQDKGAIDIQKVNKKYGKLLRKRFGIVTAEPHYLNIKPCIVAEQYLDVRTQPGETRSLVDYKIWCFDGQPECVLVCSDRNSLSLSRAMYDLDWNYHPEWTLYNEHYVKPTSLTPRPASLERMIEAAAVLSKGFPEVRVDFYDIEGRPYFGEMTFTAAAGRMNYYSQDFLDYLGSKVKLPLERQ